MPLFRVKYRNCTKTCDYCTTFSYNFTKIAIIAPFFLIIAPNSLLIAHSSVNFQKTIKKIPDGEQSIRNFFYLLCNNHGSFFCHDDGVLNLSYKAFFFCGVSPTIILLVNFLSTGRNKRFKCNNHSLF